VALGQGFVLVLLFYHVIVITPTVLSHSLTNHLCYMIVSIDSIVK